MAGPGSNLMREMVRRRKPWRRTEMVTGGFTGRIRSPVLGYPADLVINASNNFATAPASASLSADQRTVAIFGLIGGAVAHVQDSGIHSSVFCAALGLEDAAAHAIAAAGLSPGAARLAPITTA